jgi:hypothetical protein
VLSLGDRQQGEGAEGWQGWRNDIPSVSAQQNQHIDIDLVSVGYDNDYHFIPQTWFAVTAEVTNHGDDMQGVVEWTPKQNRSTQPPTFQQTLDLPRGSTKRVTLYVQNTLSFQHSWFVQFRDENQVVVARKELQLSPLDEGDIIIGVLSSNTTMLNSLISDNIRVLHMELRHIPEYGRALSGIDILVLHDLPTNTLTPEQLNALEQWIKLGGKLVIGGGIHTEATTAGLTSLLPVSIRGIAPNTSLQSLHQIVSTNIMENFPQTATVTLIEPHPKTISPDGEQLITIRHHGFGQVIFCGFDIAALRAWYGEPELWETLLLPTSHLEPMNMSEQGFVLDNSVSVPEFQVPKTSIIFLYLLGYIILVVPVNFIVFRKRGRPEWLWISTPIIVIIFVVGTYIAGTLMRGSDMRLYEISLVHAVEGEPEGWGLSFLGVFSPHRTKADFSFPAESLVFPVDHTGNDEHTVVWTDTATKVENFLLDIATFQLFHVERPQEVSINVKSNVHRLQGNLIGSIENVGDQPWIDAGVVHGNGVQWLGRVEPGQSHQINVSYNQGTFPDSVQLSHSEEDEEDPFASFNREGFLRTVFARYGGSIIVQKPMQQGYYGSLGIPDTQHGYLLVWGTKPPLDVKIDQKRPYSTESIVLYIIQLSR